MGGGFAGNNAVKVLRRAPVKVTLIDKQNHYLFQPLLYQVATGGLAPEDIAEPLRGVFRRQKNVKTLMANVRDVDPGKKLVLLDEGEVGYDFLIVGAGATHDYSGHDEWSNHAPGLKTINDAMEIRRRIFTAFEKAERECEDESRCSWLTFVVIGAGPTGVELVSTLAEVARATLKHDFRHIDPRQARILLVEAQDAVLNTYPESLSKKARRRLEKLGVSIETGRLVTDVTPEGVQMKTGDTEEFIASQTVLWAGGIRASALGRKIGQRTGAQVDELGRVVTNRDFSAGSYKDVFVVGDLCHYKYAADAPLPQLAQVAMQQGTYVANAIIAGIKGIQPKSFIYRNYGNLSAIGRASAVGQVGKRKLSGLGAWLYWSLVHLYQLLDFENRPLVFLRWAWSYLTFSRSARIITRSPERHKQMAEATGERDSKQETVRP